MKRVISLILVLGLASSACAELTAIQLGIDGSSVGPEYDVVTGNTISVEMYSGNTNVGSAYLNFEDNGLYTLANPQVTTNAGDQGGWGGPYTYGGYLYYTITVSRTATGPPIVPGTMFTVDFAAGSSTGTVDVILQKFEGTTTMDTLTINIVPEPMTITLLALGGIAMLRKRK